MDEIDPERDSVKAADSEGDELPPLLASLVPRWLAGAILVLLVASGVATAWMLLTR
jgi:hypothetical protein